MYAAGIVHVDFAIFGVVGDVGVLGVVERINEAEENAFAIFGDVGGMEKVAWEKKMEVGGLRGILLIAEVASTEERNDVEGEEIAGFGDVGGVGSTKEEIIIA